MTATTPPNQSGSDSTGSRNQPIAREQLGRRTRRPATGEPQKIFLSSDKVVDRPPVLFRIPAVNMGGSTPTEDEAPIKRQDSGNNQEATLSGKAGQSSVSAPHFGSKPTAAENFAEAVVAAKAAEQPPLAETPVTIEKSTETERPPEKTPKANRPQPIPIEPAPVPAGRSWTELIGSRLTIVLMVLAIATLAFWANRDPGSRSETELAIHELGNADPDSAEMRNVEKGADSNSRRDSLAGVKPSVARPKPNDLTSKVPQKAEKSWGGVQPVDPDFSIKDLMGPKQAQPQIQSPKLAANPSGSTTEPGQLPPTEPTSSPRSSSLTAPVNASAEGSANGTENRSAGTTEPPSLNGPTAASPKVEPTRESDTPPSWQEDLAAMEVDPNQWASAPTQTTATTDQAAIDAAVAAAMNSRNQAPVQPQNPQTFDLSPRTTTPTSGAGSQPPVLSTSQPVGIADWSKYLPPSNAGELPSNNGNTYSQQPNPGMPANPGMPMNPVMNPGMPADPGMIDGGQNYFELQPNLLPPGQMNPPAGSNAYQNQTFSQNPAGNLGQANAYNQPNPYGQSNSSGQPAGFGQPQFGQPQSVQNPPQPHFGQPAFGQPTGGAPAYGQSPYGQQQPANAASYPFPNDPNRR